jgi:protein TonB
MKMDVTSSVEPKKEEPKPNTEEIYTSAYRMPSFPGGDAALMKYISKNIRYPQMAKENGIQGKVVVQFVVTKTGKIGDVKVMRGVDKALDREAVRVCKSLPAFSPGRNAEGDPVNVWYTIPIAFKLKGAK